MLQFVAIPQQTPPKRAVDLRRRDFDEIYDEYQPEQAAAHSLLLKLSQ